MPEIKINGKTVQAADGSTVLSACRQQGLDIPTLCHKDDLAPHTSCMLCVVADRSGNRLIPSCTALVKAGMVIETEADDVRSARKSALQLLLDEHTGDCEGPCRRGCPAHMDIPKMIRHIAAGRHADALKTILEDIPFPSILGRICPAPCEKVCRRSAHDGSLAICLLKRYIGDWNLERKEPMLPERAKASGKRVAIVGAGPAGLSAAFYLLRAGHACTVLDRQDQPGGAMLSQIPEERLPRRILAAELDVVRRMGAELRMSVLLGKDIELADLERQYDAVALCTGAPDASGMKNPGLAVDGNKIVIDRNTYRTSSPRIFAGGAIVGHGKMAVRAVRDGRIMAASIDQLLRGAPVTGLHGRFNSFAGKLRQDELQAFLTEGSTDGRVRIAEKSMESLDNNQTVKESGRCLHCDCRKADSCRLRDMADLYTPPSDHMRRVIRKTFEQVKTPSGIIFEPGKCILCGICVRITEKEGEKLGLTFADRGFATRIEAPFREPLEAALTISSEKCVRSCPTGALSFAAENTGKS